MSDKVQLTKNDWRLATLIERVNLYVFWQSEFQTYFKLFSVVSLLLRWWKWWIQESQKGLHRIESFTITCPQGFPASMQLYWKPERKSCVITPGFPCVQVPSYVVITNKWSGLKRPSNWPLLMRNNLEPEIVETTFVISRFSDIRKETTLFLVVPKKPDQERCSFSVGSDNYTTRNDQKQTN